MKQNYKEALAEPIYQNFAQLEDDIMSDIIRRIKKSGEITSTADWQINLLKMLGNSTEDIENMIKNTLDVSYPEVFELYDQVIDSEYTRNRDIYEQINAKFTPYEENGQMKQMADGFIQQSGTELSNITQSMGFYLDYGGGDLAYTPLADIYQGYLDNAMYGIASGAFDYNTMLRKTIKQLTNSGLRAVDYASGYSSRVAVAVRRAVMTGASQLIGKISDMNADKLGTEYFEVAWHENARPSHRVWQGKVWTKDQLVSVCGLGSVTGLLGANCYHEYYPFFPGLSERNWSDDWLQEQDRKEDMPKTFKGKEYTAYEATQKQRNMETAMRAQRQRVKLLREGGIDPNEIMLARAKYQGQLDEYSKFSKKMGLIMQRERIYIDLQGMVAPGSRKEAHKILAKEQEDDTIKAELKEAGLKGRLNLKPYKIDVNSVSFDEDHINKQRGHDITLEEAKSYITNAYFSETVWKGRFERYYSENGIAYVNRNNLQIRTAFKKKEISGSAKKALEVMKKYGR